MKIDFKITEIVMDEVKSRPNVRAFNMHAHGEFTDLEIAALKKAGVWEQTFYSFDYHPESIQVQEWDMLNCSMPVKVFVEAGNFHQACASMVEAQNAIEEFKNGLRTLKQHIDSVSTPTEQTFEL